MDRCTKCGGFVPKGTSRCVHCGGRAISARALFYAAAAASSTFIACHCYGLPPCDGNVHLQGCQDVPEFEDPGVSTIDSGVDAGDAGNIEDAGDGGESADDGGADAGDGGI